MKKLKSRKEELLVQTQLLDEKPASVNSINQKRKRAGLKLNNQRKRVEDKLKKWNLAKPKIKNWLLEGHRNISIYELLNDEGIKLDIKVITDVTDSLTSAEKDIMNHNKKIMKEKRKK